MIHAQAFVAILLDESWITLEQAAASCGVEPDWLESRVEEGLFPEVTRTAGMWRLSGRASRRARTMRAIERDFAAVPELAALVADLVAEVDELRRRLAQVGPADDR